MPTPFRKYDLEDRLITFAARIVRYVDRLPRTLAGKHLGGQLLRSGTAPALHYGEAQAAESARDFIHKLKIGHKELKESRANLRIVEEAELMPAADPDHVWLRKECGELIAIIGKSISTTAKNMER